MKSFILTFLFGVFTVLPISALEYHNTTQKVTHFDYSTYTVTYVDEDNVSNTVPITDEALTPEHQMALLREVYTNPNIPGIHYAYDYNGYQTRKIDYNRRGHLGDSDGNWVGSKTQVYPNPIQDGMTLLLVQVKDSWKTSYHNEKDLKEYFRKAIASIKLIPNFTRVNDSQNPGYLFSIDGATNRFFFISKGKPRASYTKPLYALFEQISPVDAMTGNQATESFIDEIKTGHAYFCFHDCSNVFSMTGGHWFTISKSGENYNLYDLAIFIPDRRFEYEQDPTMPDNEIKNNQYFYNEYGNSQNVGEEVWDIMPRTLMYRVELSASLDNSSASNSSFNIILDWDSSFDGLSVPEHFYVYTVNEQGERTLLGELENQPTQGKHFEYSVPRRVDPYQIHYIITGAPIIYEPDNTTVVMGSDGKPLSTISADSKIVTVTVPGMDPYFTEAVSYRSRYSIQEELNIYKNTISIFPTTLEDYQAIKNDSDAFQIIREDNLGGSITIASIIFIPTPNGYSYSITYNSESQNTVTLYDDELPISSGELTGFSDSKVTVIDRFTASTSRNQHPEKYSYRLVQDNTGNHSNICEIPVYKTTSSVHGVGYSLEDVQGDVEGNLPGYNEVSIEFPGIENPICNIDKYEVYNVNSVQSPKLIGKAENLNNSGQYNIIGLNSSGHLNDRQGTYSKDLLVLDHNYSSGKRIKYVVTISTVDGNTYGSDAKEIIFPSIQVSIMNLVKTNPFSGAYGLVMAYETNLKLTPTVSGEIPNVYYYRIWRNSGNSEVLLNDVPNASGPGWQSTYDGIKDEYPGEEDIFIDDIFIDELLQTSKPVTYTIRMYSTDGEKYYISDKTVTATFNSSVVTGIENTYSDWEAEYYNPMGIMGKRPHRGVNIVIRRRGDTKIIEKRIY